MRGRQRTQNWTDRGRSYVRLHVALAEDDPDARSAMTEILERAGYRVESITDGHRLVESIRLRERSTEPGDRVDVIVTDVCMPRRDGLEAIRHLREQGLRTPAVVISAFDDEALRDQVQALGGAVFLPKPFAPHELEATVAQVTTPQEYETPGLAL